jgi:hypothetical protein
MRIHKNIKFGNRSHIPRHTNCPAHNHQATELLHGSRSLHNGASNIGQGAEGNNGKILTVLLDQTQESLYGLPLRDKPLGQRVAPATVWPLQLGKAAQPVYAMDPSCRVQGTA